MTVVVLASHTAEAALIAVEGPFVEGHPNVALWAMVFRKAHPAARAFVGPDVIL